MADEVSGKSPAGSWETIGSDIVARFASRRVLLVCITLVLLVLVIAAQLTWVGAAFGFLALIAAAGAIPLPADTLDHDLAGHGEAAETLREQTIRSLVDTMPDPCLILDRRSIVVHANGATMRQFPTARPGQPIAFSLRNPAFLAAVEAARRLGVAQTVEMHETVPTATWHKVTVSPLREPDDEPDADPALLVVTMQTLTELKRVDAMRTDFIANVSHELRTPLTSLIGFIDTLLGPAARDTEARERFLGIMRSQAERMSKLIDDLLSLSRIELRQHVRPTGTVDLLGLLHEVRDSLQTQARQAGMTINIEGLGTRSMITGERDELYEVFENLLENAIKYGDDGTQVDIILSEATPGTGYDYLVSIIDNGRGIPEEHVPRLTERFYRVDVDSSRKKKGTGLGLAIVKHIVTRHRGLLSIKSKPGSGTRVDVSLPR